MIKAFVYVIESPGDQDLLDGRTEGRALCESLDLAGIPSAYSLVTTKQTLHEALHGRLLEVCKSVGVPEGRFPIVHLSAHGSEEGIQLTSGDFVSWHELQQRLEPLMLFMDNGLLVCMSSCHGVHAIKMAMQRGAKPHFGWLVGSSSQPLWADAAVGFITFYQPPVQVRVADSRVRQPHAASVGA